MLSEDRMLNDFPLIPEAQFQGESVRRPVLWLLKSPTRC